MHRCLLHSVFFCVYVVHSVGVRALAFWCRRCVCCQCRTVWITRAPPSLLSAQALSPPNPRCYVCAHQALELHLDTHRWTLRRLFREVLMQHLAMNEPSIDVTNRESGATARGTRVGQPRGPALHFIAC